MKFTKKILWGILLLGFVAAPATSYATNGIFLNGYGAKSAAMGGIGIAVPLDAITATHVNPAGTAFIENTIDLGVLMLNPQRRVACCAAPKGIVSQKNLFFIPNMGITYKLDEKISLSAGMVGLGGGRTKYDFNFFDSSSKGSLGIKLEIGEMNGTIAYKINPKNAVAVSVLVVAQRFDAKGLGPFKTFSIDRDNLTDRGHDWSFGMGVRFGWQGKFMGDKLLLGAMWQPKVNMQEFDKYRGLFANEGEFDIPENYAVGIGYKVTDDLLVSLDIQRVLYNDLKSVGNSTLPISAAPNNPANLGRSTGPGFGWKNSNVFKLGAKFDYNEFWTFMAGFNYGRSPIPDENGGGELEFNVLAPATTERHISGGATYRFNEKHQLTGTAWHAFNNKQTQFIPSGTGLPFEDETIEIEMEQYAFEVGYQYQY